VVRYRTLNKPFFGALRALAFGVLVFGVVASKNLAFSQTLIVNEVSNGPSGNQEYVELVVVSQTAFYDCGITTPPCIDIRGWIIDDNSGYHGTSGIAPGAVRFSFDPMWQCVPLGTIILIYNNGDPNTSLPPQDLSMTDGNCAIVAPISNTSLFETNTTTPGALACSYPSGGWTAGGNWSSTLLANGGDCMRLVDLSGCEVFSLCNGSDNLNNMIYFAGSGQDDVWYFNGGDPFQQANWSEGCADNEVAIDAFTCGSNMQTPGAPNNAANAAYIAQFNNGCQPITPLSVSATSTIDNCNCSGTATATASGSIPGYTYAWYNASWQAIGQTGATATGLCSGTYYVIASSSIDCADTAMVVVGQNSPATVSVNSDVICSGSSTTLTATASPAGGTFSWTPNNETSSSITVSPISTSTYVVSYTSLGCTVTAVSTVNVNAAPTVNAGADISICVGQFATLSGAIGSSATSGLWTSTSGSIVDPTSLTSNFDPGTAAGTITLTLTTNDPNGPCPASSDQMVITVSDLPIVSGGSDIVVCPGGTGTLTATGANTYTWSPTIQNGVPFSPTSAGTYTVTGTSTAGCVNTDQVLVSFDTNPTIVANDVTACANGTVNLTATGGSTYSWAPALNLSSTTGATVTFTAGSTTTYVVTGTSASGCVGQDIATVTVTASPSVNAGNDVSICAGQSTVLTASGATTYQWTGLPAGNGISVSPTVTTTYTVLATGVGGCISTDQVVVTVNALPVVNGGPDINACPNTPITLTATGANTYSWNPSIQNGVPFTPIVTMNYLVTGTSAQGCTGTDFVLVTMLPAFSINTPPVSVCQNLTANLVATGGVSYTWSPATNLSATTGSNVTFTPGTNTNYTVVGTNAAGCTATSTLVVTVKALPLINAGFDATICSGQSSILTASGGNSYQWTGLAAGNPITVNPTATTTYTVTGTGANGCTNTDQILVTVNALPVVNGGPDITACPNTQVTLSATGANTYSWNPSVQNGVPFTPTTTMNYLVTGTSAQGCTGTDFVLVTLLPAFTISTPPVSVCQNLTANLVATGALSYSWSPATNLSATSGGTVTFTPGTNTNYTVTGTNAAGCTATSSLIVTVKPLPLINAGFDATICAGQSTVLAASGGNTYQWTGLAAGNNITVTPSATTTYTVTGTGANGCTNTDQILVTVNPLPVVSGGADVTVCPLTQVTLTATGANTYSWNPIVQNGVAFTPTTTTNFQVTGTSNLGCTATDLVLVTVLPAPALSTPNVATCENGTVNVVATGAQSYTWSPATNLSGITGGSLLFTAGNTTTYTIVGTSANGCTASSNLVVTVNPLPSTNAGTDVSICAGQSTTLTATGANTYSWTGTVGNPISVTPAATTTYTVTGTSSAGCTNQDQVTVTVNPLPTVNGGADVTVCSGQPVTLTATGSTSYSWNPAITNGVSFNPTTSTTYVVTGTSALGCTATDNVLVTVNPNPVVVVNDVAICVDGTASLTASGANTYSWSPATNLSGATGSNVTFTAGASTTYTITGTSAAGCTGTDNATVTVNALPVINAGVDQVVCEGNQITLTATGGTSYTWNPAATNGVAFTPAVGTTLFTVTGTNANGCIATDQISVLVNPNPIVDAGADLALCAGEQATLLGSGAQTYSWSGSVVDGTPFTPVATTTYTVTGTSAAGCTSTDALILTVNPIPTVNAGIDVETCAGQNVTLAGSGAATYSWDGSVINNQPFLPPTGTTVYTVTGTSAAGCEDTDQVSVLVNPNYQATFVPSETFGCAPVSVTLYNTTAGGSIDCSWTLSNGVTLQGCDSVSFVLESAGCLDVTLSVNAANGCSSTVTQADVICVEETPIAEFAPLPNVITVFDPPVQFVNTSSGAAQYIWDFGDGSPLVEANDPSHDYSQDSVGAYLVTLLATSPSGCTDTAFALIQIIDDVIFYVPNSFTPDGDIVNQTFQPVFTSGFDPAEYSLRIFNRWGEVVFESNDASIGWDGGYGMGSNYRMMQDGVYTWKIEFTVLQTDERIMKVGHVSLLR
jgi:gliding motility-associated-like protein